MARRVTPRRNTSLERNLTVLSKGGVGSARPSTAGAKRQERDAARAITLQFVNAEIPEHEITLTGLPVTIGRSPEADVQLEDSGVSRQHCEIDEMNGRPIVPDLDSKNGTFINGAAVQQAVVKPEDRITVGRIRLRVRCNTQRTEMAAEGERLAHTRGS